MKIYKLQLVHEFLVGNDTRFIRAKNFALAAQKAGTLAAKERREVESLSLVGAESRV
jgi:hypothetical protein